MQRLPVGKSNAIRVFCSDFAWWRVVGVALVWSISASAPAQSAPPVPTEPVAAQRAYEVFATLQQRLQERLASALRERGPAGAVEVCRVEAPDIAAAVGKERQMEVGRTSHKLRNPANAPRPWIEPYLSSAAGRKPEEVKPVVVDLGNRWGVLRPIATAGTCLVCHGDPRGFDPSLRETLQRLYPQDRAVGFQEGEFRGFFWAEVPKDR